MLREENKLSKLIHIDGQLGINDDMITKYLAKYTERGSKGAYMCIITYFVIIMMMIDKIEASVIRNLYTFFSPDIY